MAWTITETKYYFREGHLNFDLENRKMPYFEVSFAFDFPNYEKKFFIFIENGPYTTQAHHGQMDLNKK